jgi:hypothetical protein
LIILISIAEVRDQEPAREVARLQLLNFLLLCLCNNLGKHENDLTTYSESLSDLLLQLLCISCLLVL